MISAADALPVAEREAAAAAAAEVEKTQRPPVTLTASADPDRNKATESVREQRPRRRFLM
jgi:hypothetical protein